MTCNVYDRLTLLNYVSGDCTDDRKREIEQHCAGCSECIGIVQAAREERERFLEEFPVIPVVPPPMKKVIPFRRMTTLLSVAAVLLIAVGVTRQVFRHSHTNYRIKGNGVDLHLFVSDSSGQPVEPENPVFTPGERIQFTYSCTRERFMILASVDETGRISVFYPMNSDSSMAMEPGAGLPLPHSILLDDYIGKERFFAVFSARPLRVAAVVDTLRQIAEGKNDLKTMNVSIDGAVIRSILLVKKEYQR